MTRRPASIWRAVYFVKRTSSSSDVPSAKTSVSVPHQFAQDFWVFQANLYVSVAAEYENGSPATAVIGEPIAAPDEQSVRWKAGSPYSTASPRLPPSEKRTGRVCPALMVVTPEPEAGIQEAAEVVREEVGADQNRVVVGRAVGMRREQRLDVTRPT